MWKGRFAKDTSSLVQEFGESISYDWRLYPHDIAGSIAHARAQKTAGLLTAEEFSQKFNQRRHFDYSDLAADYAGIWCAGWLALRMLRGTATA